MNFGRIKFNPEERPRKDITFLRGNFYKETEECYR